MYQRSKDDIRLTVREECCPRNFIDIWVLFDSQSNNIAFLLSLKSFRINLFIEAGIYLAFETKAATNLFL